MFDGGTYNANTNTQSFIGFVQQGKIFNSYGQQLGVTSDEYNKAIETAKGFEKILYEKGILQKPKTPEEINQELQETMKQMMLSIKTLNDEITTLKRDSKNVEQTKLNEFSGAISRQRKSQESKPGV